MNANKFIKDYKKFLEENHNLERAKKEKAYLYSDLKHYGVSVWDRRKFYKKYNEEIKSLSKSAALRLAKHFWNQPHHEERSMALHILNVHSESLDISDMSLIEKFMRESRGWAPLDSLIIPIMPIILEKDKRVYKYLKKWIKDDDFWVRRSALLALLLFFRNGKGGYHKLFFELAKSQFDESWIGDVYKDRLQNKRAKFFIRKAIGWTLREMSQKNPKVVFNFVKKNKGEMSGLTFREATRRLPDKMRKELSKNQDRLMG